MGFALNHFLHFLLLCLSLLLNHQSSSNSTATLGIEPSELRALMELKSSLDPEGRVLSSWAVGSDPCGFEGVTWNEHGKVANISLQGKGLIGTILPSVSGLRWLSGLYLHYNAFGGEVPRELASLTGLLDLYLNINNLSGTIPEEIGTMASLQVLQHCYNQLTWSIPEAYPPSWVC
ncbi:LRR receptor-like serine/threonine-protein kinase GSO2 [Iris pallida]|uniref:LRR receptor-like serine/threonine-protein kinase GSO2 n=1 Tax=Iris pallida TaxID=29817 RepID=A0AAX6HS02_IRIPA|nr:LRR receptor-like serine/threonine-protein kinase GSO2 [Iris pallida]KAJ6843859.1 LRR receptor-like serine/threonine-protein kinase GSO2 [Iris pallida]